MSNTESLDTVVTPAWLAQLASQLPGAELALKEDWGAHILSVGGKQFARLGTDSAGRPTVTYKGDPFENEALRQEFDFIVPGYYSNKVHWNSVHLVEATFGAERLAELLTDAHAIVFSSLTKRLQSELSDA